MLATFMAVAVIIGGAAEAQQPAKSGKYTGKFWGHGVPGVAQTYELEKGHVFFLGQGHGVFLNDVADGFLDKTEVTCPVVEDILNGVITAAHGYCVMADKDGDKAFLVWRGKGPARAPSSGPVVPESSWAFKETTTGTAPILAKREPSQ